MGEVSLSPEALAAITAAVGSAVESAVLSLKDELSAVSTPPQPQSSQRRQPSSGPNAAQDDATEPSMCSNK